MRTPAELARECAECLAVLETVIHHDGLGSWCRAVVAGVQSEEQRDSYYEEQMQWVVDAARDVIAAAVQASIEQALAACPVPSPVGEDELDTARKVAGLLPDPPTIMHSLLDHIGHLHRILNSPESEAIANAYEQGRRDGERQGAKRQREADMKAIHRQGKGYSDTTAAMAVFCAHNRVLQTPLVTDKNAADAADAPVGDPFVTGG